MVRVKLNKTELQQQSEKLRLYQRLLPSLDLKRRQLTIQIQVAKEALDTLTRKHTQLNDDVAGQLPMLANESIQLSSLVEIDSVDADHENIAGVKLPRLVKVVFCDTEYSKLATPVWVDTLVEYLQRGSTLKLKIATAQHRLQQLEQALLKINQRVNLFDKVLIPHTKTTIKRIRLFLSDLERDAVVRSKLAKSHH
jgi:V/A-type H+/Na+-transporting ATPase subunit D